jgi:hypothetical protein
LESDYGRGGRVERIKQETVHALLPLDVAPRLREQLVIKGLAISGAGTTQIGLAVVDGLGKRQID